MPTYQFANQDYVSDPHNIELAGTTLGHLRSLNLRRIKGNGSDIAPSSQDDYWTLMFHADSLFEGGLYGEAKQTYDLAFTEDRYILPYHLSEVARKMMGIRNDDAAHTYLSHRRRNTARRWDLTVYVRCWMPRASMSGERRLDFRQSR